MLDGHLTPEYIDDEGLYHSRMEFQDKLSSALVLFILYWPVL